MMLFLGAGASKPFGIKTMAEISDEFENNAGRILNRTRSYEEEALYHEIRGAIGTNNLEEILTILNDLSDKVQSPTVRYLESQLRHGRDITESILELIGELISPNLSKELQSTIIRFIKENCDLEGGKKRLTDIFREYNRLFEILKFNTSPIFDIFTTNYDLVIEMYHDLHFTEDAWTSYISRISFTDGFLLRAFRENDLDLTINDEFRDNVWDPGKYDAVLSNGNSEDIPTLRLFKLHGSIDQYYQNGEIVKKDILFPTRTIGGGELRDSMIYPMRAKEIYKDPFFELFTRLKDCLINKKNEICVVIGYSFRDEHIRNIFFDAVKRNPEIRIFMISPNAKKIRDDLEHIKHNIEPIEGKFGEEKVFEELKQKLSEV